MLIVILFFSNYASNINKVLSFLYIFYLKNFNNIIINFYILLIIKNINY